jgi:nucleotide-binding universal stress UspA family protein
MESSIVVGVDETDHSLMALDAAAGEAALRGRPLHVLHADPFGEPLAVSVDERPSASGSWALDRAVDRARAVEPAVEVTGELVRRFPQPALIKASENAELVVIGDRGLSTVQRTLVDTVADGLAARSSCPVLVIRGIADPSGPIVVGVDGSAAGEAAAGFAFAEADLRECRLLAIHAWSRPVAHDASRSLPVVFDEGAVKAGAERLLSETLAGWREKYPDVRVQPLLVHGHPRRVLTEAGNGADLTIVGTRGAGILTDLKLGSVAAYLLHNATSPVVVVPEKHGESPGPA